MGTQTNNSVVRVFEILRQFNKQQCELSASEISGKTGMHLSTVHRFLLTLEKIGAVVRAPDGRFQLGIMMAEIGEQVSVHKVLADTITPFVNDLVQKHRETVHAAILQNNEVVYVSKGETPRSLRINTYVGKVLHAYGTGVGKVLLAGRADNEIWEYIRNTQLEAFTKNTIVDPDQLFEEIITVRKQKFALDREETEEGLSCIAVPILDEYGGTVAAISISGPTGRMNAGMMDTFFTDLSQSADLISKKLYQGEDSLKKNET